MISAINITVRVIQVTKYVFITICMIKMVKFSATLMQNLIVTIFNIKIVRKM